MRTAVLACGFGLGIAVMAELLGVGEVILDQARAPALHGGGDLVVEGAFGTIDAARFVLFTLTGRRAEPRVKAAAPSARAPLYLVAHGAAVPVVAKGGVPSLERAVGDPEVRGVTAWTDAASDSRWTSIAIGDVLRDLDRFHAQPDVPEFASSWAEWLYFNGRTRDGRVRFYLTFLAGPRSGADGMRSAGVRLQLDRDGRVTNYSSVAQVSDRELQARAPDVEIGANRVRLEDGAYRLTLHLREEQSGAALDGTLALAAAPGRSLPPLEIRGARGWLSGYVVPVLAGRIDGTLTVDGRPLAIGDAIGYHDHNWGFWRDVRWQWGQVSGAAGGEDLSFVYGRVFPPPDVADPERMPGFLGVIGPSGIVGTATNVTIAEQDDRGAPRSIRITARGGAVDVALALSVDRVVRTQLAMTGGASDFVQMGGVFRVNGRAGGQAVDFSARGAAETFRRR